MLNCPSGELLITQDPSSQTLNLKTRQQLFVLLNFSIVLLMSYMDGFILIYLLNPFRSGKKAKIDPTIIVNETSPKLRFVFKTNKYLQNSFNEKFESSNKGLLTSSSTSTNELGLETNNPLLIIHYHQILHY